ncbi:MAG: TMEM175 family protein [Rhodoferax sp.]
MSTQFHMHKARLETLVDGVFAIAMTILVLEVKVPEITDGRSTDALLHALAHHGYVIGAYFFSFAMLALFWVWHHRLVEKIREFDFPLLVCTLVFLALVCFFPFAAALLGRYPLNLGALLVYVPLTGMIVLLQTLLFALAVRRQLLVDSVSADDVLATQRRNFRGCAIFFFASIPTALRVHVAWIGVCVVLGVFFLWLARARVKHTQKAA